MTRKQLILNSAITLFSEKGIESTSIQQITDHCGISKGAFYLSFKSKDELVFSIIEHFLNTVTNEVDQAVSAVQEPSEKLYSYFSTLFTILSQYAAFAEILMREKASVINEELIAKIHYYVVLSNKNLERLLFLAFGEHMQGKQYDLVLIVNGMVQTYLQWHFETKKPVNIDLLARSLVEKTRILAMDSTIIFLDEACDMYASFENVSGEQMVKELQQVTAKAQSSLEHQSLQLLIEELQREQPRQAIILGLISHLKENEHFNWTVTYLQHKYR